jgi:hypothetical protein
MESVKLARILRPARLTATVANRFAVTAHAKQVNRHRPVRPTAAGADPGALTNSVALIPRAIPAEPVPKDSFAPGKVTASPQNHAKGIAKENSAEMMDVEIVAAPVRLD